MRFIIILSALVGCCLKNFGQCPTWAITTDGSNPFTTAWNSEFNKDSRKLYVSGEFGVVPFQIGAFQLNSLYLPPDYSNAYLLQLDETGNVDWVKHMGKKFDSTLRGRLVSTNDGVISAFGFNDTAYVEGVEYSTDAEHILLSKFDTDGNLSWIHQLKSDYVQVASIVFDDVGSVYALGNFYNWVSIDDDTLHVLGDPIELGTEVFMAKFKSTGELIWLKYVGGGTEYNTAEALTYSNGKLFGCGRFREEMNIGTENFVSSSFKNGFLFSMDTTGVIGWSHHFMSENADPLAIKALETKLLVAGLFEAPMTIDGIEIVGDVGAVDGFIIDFSHLGALQASKSLGGDGAEILDGIEIIGDSLYLISGYSRSTSFQVDGLQFQNVANEPGSFNQNHFALVVDEELKAECLYYTESTNSSLGLETNFNHVSGDTVWVVNGFSGELPIGDTTLYSLGGTTFIAKTCMGCEELIRLDVPFVAKQEVQFDVYPNPASQTVRVGIQGSSHKPQSITFIDMLGHALLHHKTTANENNIDISGLASGLYIVAATFENGEAARQRVVVQH